VASCHIFTQHHKPEDLGLNLHPEDGGSMDFRNFGILIHHYTVSQPRSRLESSPWRWGLHRPPKWYPATSLHGVAT